tara:strand:- start:14557 stop:17133 length:2577 start_codon:yes stop_codon:yes gene_type:complete
MIQSQSQFGGGINTLLPRHRIPDGSSVDVVDADVFDGTLKSTPTFGTTDGGQVYYYEAGASWVGSAGFSDRTVQDQLIVDSSTGNLTSASHVGAGTTATFNTPLTIDRGFSYTIDSGDTITVQSAIRGLFNANSFVEYNEDLYVGRNSYFVEIDVDGNGNPLIVNDANAGTSELTLVSGQIDRVHQGDQIEPSDLIPEFTEIVSISYDVDKITINNTLATNTGITQLAMNATPIRVIDGNLNNTYQLGFPVPEPSFSFVQVGSNTTRTNSHTSLWYSTPSAFYPIPYQYGISKYDFATGAESAMSDLSDPALSAGFLLKQTSEIHKPLRIDVSNLSEGMYALYRTGGTSSVLKRVAVLLVGYSATTISASIAGDDITVTITNPPSGRYQLRVYGYSGQTYDYTPTFQNTSSFTFARDITGTAHNCDIFLEVEVEDDPFKRTATLGAITIENGVVTAGQTNDKINFLDFIPAQALIDIQPIQNATLPPMNMEFLTEVNNFFFGVDGRTLNISRYADPNNWPIDGYLSFDNTITALSKRGSDLLVFTTYNLYRVFGSSPESMRKVKIPTVEGCPAGLDKCIQPVGNGVLYISATGMQYFDGATVRNVTKEMVGDFTTPSPNNNRNVAGVIDNQYYLLSPSNDGYVMDVRQGSFRLSRSSLRASNLHYRGNTNKLYNEVGALGEGSSQGYDVTTRSFDGGNRSKQKIFSNFSIVGENFDGTGTIDFLVDQQLVESFPAPTTQLLGRTFRLSDAAVGLEAQIQLNNITGRTMRLDVEMDLLEEQRLRRWNYVELQYTGALTVSVLIDGNASISNFSLPDTAGETQTAQIFFPAMTEGEIAHLTCVETETNKVLRVNYDAEEI